VIISFEGGEGAGKSTHARLLCDHLQKHGLPWLSVREPGGSSFSERVRELFFQEGLDPMTELLLVLASRRHNLDVLVKPALSEGRIVVIDRFVDSTLVYQGVLGGIGIERVREIMELTGTWLEPDLTFVLDIDPGLSLARIVPGDKFELRERSYHDRLRHAFLDLAKSPRHRVIDAQRPCILVSSDIHSAVDVALAAGG
jgi:dTMP kinase